MISNQLGQTIVTANSITLLPARAASTHIRNLLFIDKTPFRVDNNSSSNAILDDRNPIAEIRLAYGPSAGLLHETEPTGSYNLPQSTPNEQISIWPTWVAELLNLSALGPILGWATLRERVEDFISQLANYVASVSQTTNRLAEAPQVDSGRKERI